MIIVSGEVHKKLRSVAVNFINTSRSSLHFLNYIQNLALTVIKPWKHLPQVSFIQQAKEVPYIHTYICFTYIYIYIIIIIKLISIMWAVRILCDGKEFVGRGA